MLHQTRQLPRGERIPYESGPNSGQSSSAPGPWGGGAGAAEHPLDGAPPPAPHRIRQRKGRWGRGAPARKGCRLQPAPRALQPVYSWSRFPGEGGTRVSGKKVGIAGLATHGLDLVATAMSENKRLSKHRDSGVHAESGGGPGPRGARALPPHGCVFAPHLGPPRTPRAPCMPADRKYFTVLPREEPSAGQDSPAETWQQTIKVEQRCYPPPDPRGTSRPVLPRQAVPGPGWGTQATPRTRRWSRHPHPPPSPCPAVSPGRAALTARLPREWPPKDPHRAPGPPGCPSHLPGPRPRVPAAAAPESECRGPSCGTPGVRASPALPKAARGVARLQKAPALKPVSAALDQTARPPRGAEPDGRRGGALRHARRPPGQSAAARWGREGGPRVPGKERRQRPGSPGIPRAPAGALPAATPRRPGPWSQARCAAPEPIPGRRVWRLAMQTRLHFLPRSKGKKRSGPDVFWEFSLAKQAHLAHILQLKTRIR